MAAMPSFDAVLLKIYQHFGLEAYQSKVKEKFGQLGLESDNHLEMKAKIIEGILDSLGLAGAARIDAQSNFDEAEAFYKAVEMNTWTSDAHERQVLWYLLGHVFVPGLARRIGFWNCETACDTGMPGGAFWFLPHLDHESGTVHLPVVQVMDWLIDLLGTSIGQAKDGLGSPHHRDGKQDSMAKSLHNWRSGVIPDVYSINFYFPDNARLVFKGAFTVDATQSADSQFESALGFLDVKGVNPQRLRFEIPITDPDRLEFILSGRANAAEKSHFVRLLQERFAAPSLRDVRQRLLVARMIQEGYGQLLRILCPGVEATCTDPKKNKLLQLSGIFSAVYNLTIHSYKSAGNAVEADALFEKEIPPWDQADFFLSILPSHFDAGPAVGKLLTTRLAACKNEILEDFIGLDSASNQAVQLCRMQRWRDEMLEMRAVEQLLERMRTSSPWRALQKISTHSVVRLALAEGGLSGRAKSAALDRLVELSSTSFDLMEGRLLKLDGLLHCDRKDRPEDVQARVQSILTDADTDPATSSAFKAPLLQYKAKHLLSQNDFTGAGELFRAALEACHENGFGSMRGIVARDNLAIAVANQGLIRGNHEKYYRNMNAYGMQYAGARSLQDTAVSAADYFWRHLYQPYPNVENLLPLEHAQFEKIAKETTGFICLGDWPGLKGWLTTNGKLFKKTKVKSVRGDTMLLLWLKMLQHLEDGLRTMPGAIGTSLPARVELEQYLSNCRHAIEIVAAVWPEQVRLNDFKGQTPLMLVADSNDVQLATAFLAAGAQVEAQDYLGRTALHSAVTGRSLGSLAAMLSYQPDVRAATSEGHTPLHTAVRMGYPDMVMLLMEYDITLTTVEDRRGSTPTDLARVIGQNAAGFKREMEKMQRREVGSCADYLKILAALDGTNKRQ